MPYSSLNIVGNQQIAFYGLPDTTERHPPGLTLTVEDSYWGSAEVIYVYANGAIRQGALVILNPTRVSGRWRWNATEVTNTANLGRPVYVAMTSMSVGQFGWVANMGIVPVNCNASVNSDNPFGIAATGQGGALTAGKQILNARVIGAAGMVIPKAGCVANAGSNRLQVPSSDGWFVGVFLSGTGIAAGTTVAEIDPSGTIVTLSSPTTGLVNDVVTATYNNGTVFYNVVHIDRPLAQGAIT